VVKANYALISFVFSVALKCDLIAFCLAAHSVRLGNPRKGGFDDVAGGNRTRAIIAKLDGGEGKLTRMRSRL